MAEYKADKIMGTLYQGPQPPEGLALRGAGISAAVLCAAEFQPDASRIPGVQLIYAPGDDDMQHPPAEHWLKSWWNAAKVAASLCQEGKIVLSVCKQGLNRSGMVSAMTVHLMTGWPGEKCAKLVQMSRQNALYNQQFVRYLSSIPGK